MLKWPKGILLSWRWSEMENQVQSLKENEPIPKWLIGIGLVAFVGLLFAA
mgnify:FL=1